MHGEQLARIQELSSMIEDCLRHFAYEPSPEAADSLAATRRYNKWIGNQKDWRKSQFTPEGLGRSQKHEEALARVHQRAVANKGILPFGKKARERRQYSKDVDWINSHLRRDNG